MANEANQRQAISNQLARDPINRRLRIIRAFVLPLRGPAGIRRIPVAHYSVGDEPGVDVPMLSHLWSVEGIVDERTIPIAIPAIRQRRGWVVYNIWFIRPSNPNPPPNPFILNLNLVPRVSGEFVVIRQTPDATRLMDVREADYRAMEAAIIRLVRLLFNGDPRWRQVR
ncbi:hypothetical protein FKP32DRAFT_1607421 [Trametes sanguinea]|nr:hypothetical protein FKP32DRAFT_1607421 [Trametes sanguinea]